tara:strand:- start:4998 stop:5300 length:303 start_codon:yes stop_codon:yes gene_type:complete
MVKSEIISILSEKTHQKLKKSEFKEILDIIVETIVEGIKDNRSCELRSFGRFSVKKIKGRINARNPRNGQIIQTNDKISISFKMSKELKREINNSERETN